MCRYRHCDGYGRREWAYKRYPLGLSLPILYRRDRCGPNLPPSSMILESAAAVALVTVSYSDGRGDPSPVWLVRHCAKSIQKIIP